MSDDQRLGDWIQTRTGRKIWPFDPRPEDFCAEQAARNGHATCTQLAALMAQMSQTQRHKLYSRGYAPKGKSVG